MRRPRERVQDMLEAIERIGQRWDPDREALERDEMLQVWVVHNIEILGEAARNVGDEVQRLHPDIPWATIASMRNTLIHQYFDIDLDEVWSVVEGDLPHLEPQLRALFEELS